MSDQKRENNRADHARSALYGFTVFNGAFLLFFLEPLAGKVLLPHFGGASGVWSAALLFFMTALLTGYLYAYLLSLLSIRSQLLIHTFLLCAALVFAGRIFASGSLQIVSANPLPQTPVFPLWDIFKVLFASIGLPFIALSATSSLLQSWFTVVAPQRIPYRLYALSNAGSLAALLSYPSLVEPYFSLSTQAREWSALFIVYGAAFFFCLASIARAGKQTRGSQWVFPESVHANALEDTQWRMCRKLAVVALAALPSLHLIATTATITQGIAPVPFFWLVPLCLYLLSFVLCFSRDGWYRRTFWGVLLGITAASSLFVWANGSLDLPIIAELFLYSFSLFSLCMVCHGELYGLRPSPRLLTGFYVFVALGGALGAAMGNIAAPLVFSRGILEFPLGLLCGGLIAIGVLFHSRPHLLPSRKAYALYLPLLVLLMLPPLAVVSPHYSRTVIEASRNFYGTIAIRESLHSSGVPLRFLMNGRILHGSQFQSSSLRRSPTSYYGRHSGAGLALDFHPRRLSGKPLRVGLVGLGSGALAAYCKEGDYFRFYEINPAVIRVARAYFSYLADCPGEVSITEGDARLSLEREREAGLQERFDVFLVDAFSDDAIPAHLLTREAFALYKAHLEPAHGILAVHVSNKYLDLAPLAAALGRDAGWESVIVNNPGSPQRAEVASFWVLASPDETLFHSSTFATTSVTQEVRYQGRLWSDEYSSIFKVLRKW